MDRPPRYSRWAWWVPVLALGAMPDRLDELGAGSHDRGLASSLVIGVLAGAFWYWRYPRPLAERLRLMATVNLTVIAVVVLGSIFDGGGETTIWDWGVPSGYGALGVLTALVLAEHVHHVVLDRRHSRARLELQDRHRADARADRPN